MLALTAIFIELVLKGEDEKRNISSVELDKFSLEIILPAMQLWEAAV
jgi:hypothetical protein